MNESAEAKTPEAIKQKVETYFKDVKPGSAAHLALVDKIIIEQFSTTAWLSGNRPPSEDSKRTNEIQEGIVWARVREREWSTKGYRKALGEISVMWNDLKTAFSPVEAGGFFESINKELILQEKW